MKKEILNKSSMTYLLKVLPNQLMSLIELTTNFIKNFMRFSCLTSDGRNLGHKKDYTRLSVTELESIRDEVLQTYHYGKKKYCVQAVAHKYNIEQGLCLILASSMWDTFKPYYEGNTVSGLYKNWYEYSDETT